MTNALVELAGAMACALNVHRPEIYRQEVEVWEKVTNYFFRRSMVAGERFCIRCGTPAKNSLFRLTVGPIQQRVAG